MAATATAGKTRSPNYPAIGLEEAVQRLKAIYEKQHRYPATRDTFAKLMGYTSLNGASATIVSALGKYGLLDGHGDNLRVSEMGQDIVLHRKGDSEYAEALRTAAFMPAFFRELRDQYPDGLPSEHSLRATLIKRGFNPKAIDGAVRAYRDTIEFVGAEVGDLFVDVSEESPFEVARQTHQLDPLVNRTATPPPPGDSWQRSVALPLSVTEWATLQAPFPLTEAAWNQMIAVLTAMKPALVALPEPPQPFVAAPAEPAREDTDDATFVAGTAPTPDEKSA